MCANLLFRCLFILLLAIVKNAQGSTTDLATTPLETASTASLASNLVFVLDDSGSMSWAFMPDSVWNAIRPLEYGLRSAQCNGVYYNPNLVYTPPVYADGSYYPNANFNAALTDGFNPLSSTVNLSTSFKAGGDSAGIPADTVGSAAYYYRYTGAQTAASQKTYDLATSTFYKECHSLIGSSPGSSVFTKVTVSGSAETQNFANWYSYYRTRMLMMKTAAGLAFKNIDNRFRVGFMATNSSASFLNLDNFDSAQKTAWYAKLYGATGSGETPLRQALANVGLLYAGKLTLGGITVNDPVQYSCQQNFTILSTDGYWNAPATSPTAGAGFKVDGVTLVGNQDATAPRPYYDGTIVTLYRSTSQLTQTQTQTTKSTSQLQKRTTQVQQKTSQLQARITQKQSQGKVQQQQISQLQMQGQTLQKRTLQLQTQTQILQKRTSQLQMQGQIVQKRVSQIQSQSGTLQKKVSQLQSQSGTLQKRTSQLQIRTMTLQKQVSQLQAQTGTWQKRITQIQKSTKVDGVWGTFVDASSCTASATVQCQTVTGAWTGAPSCTVVTTPDASGQTTECQVVWSGTWSNASTCTASSTVQCRTVVSVAWANAASCTATTTPDASGQTFQCQYVLPYGAWSNTATCTASSSVQCQTVAGTWSNAASCTATTTPDASGQTTECQTVWSGTWTNASTCTASATLQCRTTAGSWTNTPSCTVNTTPDASGQTTDCQTVWSGTWANASTCTTSATLQCRTTTGSWTNTPSCTANTTPNASGQTTECQSVWSGTWSNVSSCTASATVQCQTVWGAWANAASCTATTTPDASGQTTECQSVWSGTWVNAATCTASATVQCQTVAGAWANAASCTATTTPDASGQTTECQTVPNGVWSNASTCTDPSGVLCRTVVSVPYTTVASCTATTTPDASGQTIQCQSVWSGIWSNLAVAGGSGCPTSTATVKYQCPTGSWTNVSSCTTTTTYNSDGQRIACQYKSWSSTWSNTTTCVNTPRSTASPYTVGVAYQCQTTDTGWVGASSCVDSSSGGQTVACQTDTTGPTPVASCTGSAASSGNSWLATSCNTTTLTPATPVASCTSVSPTADNNYIATSCDTVATGPTVVSSCTEQEASIANNWTATTCNSVTSGGSFDSLSDIAMYYYMTDLRAPAFSNCTGALGVDVCGDNVPFTGLDSASWQHMTLFTLGLGASGQMNYSPTYLSDSSGDYPSVKNGVLANPPTVCSWQGISMPCNWPHPGVTGPDGIVQSIGDATHTDGITQNIDDLWHAAVNGRGTYFSATDPASLANGISGALSGISSRLGASAAATASTPNVTSGDNFVFSTSFLTQEWTGELIRQEIDILTGSIPTYDPADTNTYRWTARSQLDANTSRTIYYASSGVLKPFLWASLSASERAYFSLGNINTLSQFCVSGANCLSGTNQTNAAGANLVNFLRGERSNEGGAADTSKYYRLRTHILGDTVGSEAKYVKSPLMSYKDRGYSDFARANAARQGVVYVGANDGMLHAFNAGTGREMWAFIPSLVLPNLYKLADKNYANLHQYFVDGTPTIGDICSSSCDTDSAVWKTILVGGLRGGGRGYYALDITDPSAPELLWEFTDDNLGYTYGNPVITKLADAHNTWSVLFSSGYNNISPGDGVGRLYVVDAASGTLLNTISTGVGSASTPSGLSRIAAWVEHGSLENTTLRVYGGDLLGNVWRFDINNTVGASGYEAQLLANLTDAQGNAQPVTGRPEIGFVKTSYTGGVAMLYVGTGRYLGMTDKANIAMQSVYAIKDGLDTDSIPSEAIYGHPRDNTCASGATVGCFVKQTQATIFCPPSMPTSVCSTGETVRTSTSNTVDLAAGNGWYLDLLDPGERINTDMLLVLGSLVFNSNTPSTDSCSMGGYSYGYFVDYRTGGFVSAASIPSGGGGPGTPASGIVGQKLGNAISSSPIFIRLPKGAAGGGGGGENPMIKCSRLSEGTNKCGGLLVPPSSESIRTLSWRELFSD